MTYYGYITDSSTHGTVGSFDRYYISVEREPKLRKEPPYCLGGFIWYTESEVPGIMGESEEEVISKCVDEIKRWREATTYASYPFEYELWPPDLVVVGSFGNHRSLRTPSLHTVYP